MWLQVVQSARRRRSRTAPEKQLSGADASGAKGLYIGGFQELLFRIGCYSPEDLARRLFRIMIYPPNMGHVAISQHPRTRLEFQQFIVGCRKVFGDDDKASKLKGAEAREKRLLCIFYFYDYDRSGPAL